MDIKHKVGIRIRAVRKQHGLTQEDLAARLERSVEAVSNLERGKSLPGLETFERLSRVLDVAIGHFFDFPSDGEGGKEDPHRQQLLANLMRTARRLETGDLAVALEHRQPAKIGLSDGRGGKTIQTAMQFGYDRHEFEGYLGNVVGCEEGPGYS